MSICSAVVASLIVSSILWRLNRLNQPLFELRKVDENLGVLHYKGVRPIVIGGSYNQCQSPVLHTIDGNRQATSGIFIRPGMKLPIGIDGRPIGQEIEITYRVISWWRSITKRWPKDADEWHLDPTSFLIDKKRHEKKGWADFSLIVEPS